MKQNNANVWFALRSIHERLKSWESSAGAFTPIGSKLVGRNIFNVKALRIRFELFQRNIMFHLLNNSFENCWMHCWDRDYPFAIRFFESCFEDNLTSKVSRNFIITVTLSYLKLGKGELCTGHNNVMLSLDRPSIVRLLSPVVSFGMTELTGSRNITFLCFLSRNQLYFLQMFFSNTIDECWVRVYNTIFVALCFKLIHNSKPHS